MLPVPESSRPSIDRAELKIAEALSDAELAALEAIIRGVNAWSMATDLTDAGHTPEAPGGLEAAGMVEPWETPLGRAWTLTRWGAWERGVVIIEDHRDEPRWRYPGQEPKFYRNAR